MGLNFLRRARWHFFLTLSLLILNKTSSSFFNQSPGTYIIFSSQLTGLNAALIYPSLSQWQNQTHHTRNTDILRHIDLFHSTSSACVGLRWAWQNAQHIQTQNSRGSACVANILNGLTFCQQRYTAPATKAKPYSILTAFSNSVSKTWSTTIVKVLSKIVKL